MAVPSLLHLATDIINFGGLKRVCTGDRKANFLRDTTALKINSQARLKRVDLDVHYAAYVEYVFSRRVKITQRYGGFKMNLKIRFRTRTYTHVRMNAFATHIQILACVSGWMCAYGKFNVPRG